MAMPGKRSTLIWGCRSWKRLSCVRKPEELNLQWVHELWQIIELARNWLQKRLICPCQVQILNFTTYLCKWSWCNTSIPLRICLSLMAFVNIYSKVTDKKWEISIQSLADLIRCYKDQEPKEINGRLECMLSFRDWIWQMWKHMLDITQEL